jgi:hypothetical protein
VVAGTGANAIDAIGSLTEQERLLTPNSNSNGEEISITVTGTGIAIDPNDLDRIFEPFFTIKLEEGDLAFPFVDPLSKRMAAAYGRRRTKLRAQSFIYRCP